MTTSRRRITSCAAAVLAAAALALGACGDDGAPSAGGTATTDRDRGPLAFATCMREQGIDMPDPETSADGRVMLRVPRQAGSPAKLEAAQKACEAAMGPPRELSEEDRREARERGVAMARCMREQGVDFPDPSGDGRIRIGPGSGIDPQDPAFQRAERVCAPKARMQEAP